MITLKQIEEEFDDRSKEWGLLDSEVDLETIKYFVFKKMTSQIIEDMIGEELKIVTGDVDEDIKTGWNSKRRT